MDVNKEKKQEGVLPMLLLILDGWGIDKPNKGNAITLSGPKYLDQLMEKYPSTQLFAHGQYVGLLKGQDGNSEAGHMNIGAGRLVEQEMTKITKSIKEGTFFKNAAFVNALKHIKETGGRLHIMGMISNGMSPHAAPGHLLALVELVKRHDLQDVVLHLFTDGRDSPPFASLKLINELDEYLEGRMRIGSIMGRFYAMDRTKAWSRTEMAYDALAMGIGRKADSYNSAITEAYNRGESDEFIEPYVIMDKGRQVPRIDDGDAVIFFNLRSDRARQLAKAFVQKEFNEMNPDSFKRKKVLDDLYFAAMTDFGPDLDGMVTAFPGVDLKETLPMQLKDLRQLYLAEKEKFAHVTYFFNGGYSGTVANEDQLMVPSPNVKSYDLTPEMSTEELAKILLSDLKEKKYDFTVMNIAAPDMIGHTGKLDAGIKCCQAVDKYVKLIVDAYLAKGGTVVITADHGNIEEMINLKTGEVDTEHSTNPVPFVIVNEKLKDKIKLRDKCKLGDIAPTILELLGKDKPAPMTGKTIIKRYAGK